MSEETSGLDLVREQFRIAEGEVLNLLDDPEPRGHSIEFRINGEDAGRGFLPAPGTVSAITFPAGPGVRVDAGVEAGSVIGGQFDSLLAKLIVTGSDRPQALERARRALAEFQVEGMATVLPFHRLVVEDPAFASHELHRAHPVDRDRVGQHGRAVRRGRRGRGGGAAAVGGRRGRRPSARGVAAGRPRPGRRRAAAPARGRPRASATGRALPRPPATR